MTGQIPDEVRYWKRRFAIAAVDGTGLFDPAVHGVRPSTLSTGCWRGYICSYTVMQSRLLLRGLELGRPEDGQAPELFGVEPTVAGDTAWHPGALLYEGLAVPVEFTGRLLLGAGPVHIGYLNMGFRPAWLFERVHELALDHGRITATHDRSAEAAARRTRLGEAALRPADGADRKAWISRTFSLSYAYSWPPIDPPAAT